MSYAVADFVEDLRRLSAAHTDDRTLLPEVAPLAKKLATSPGWVRPEYYDIDEKTGIGVTDIYIEDDHTLMVATVAWAPGGGVLPHDHQTWGIVAGIDGVERNVIWKRTDDGSRDGHAEIHEHRQTNVGAGDVIGFLADDIHSVHNDGERTSLSLHVYGRSLYHVDRNEFVPDENLVRPYPDPA